VVSDTKNTKPPSLIERLRAFLDTLGDDGESIEPDEPIEVEGTPAEEETAAAIDEAETETEAEVEGEPATEPGDGEPAETTPGASESGDASDDDLREQITNQAALIETLRNALAEAGMDDPTAEAVEVEAEAEAEDDTRTEDELVADFDADYDKRQALLADLEKDK